MDIKEIISNLKNLDLSNYPSDKVIDYLKAIRRVVIIENKLHKGKVIIRARPHDHPNEEFNTRSSLSYKPQQYNTTYQRASTPNQTMFYGSIIPEEIEAEELDNERVVVSAEALKWLRDETTCGVKEITYSKWEVLEDIKLVAVIHKKEFYDSSSYTRKMVNDFHEFVKQHPDVEEPSILISDYLANEFGKEESDPDYHYLISAVYTELVCGRGFDGVLYPSVRMKGQGFNIAITPNAVDQKLKLVGAGKCIIYKRFKNSVVDNVNIANIENDSVKFKYEELPVKYRGNEKESLNRLGVDSKEDLCSPI